MFCDLQTLNHAINDLDETLESRLAELRRGNHRIAYYYDYPDYSTFRYRVYNMIEVLRDETAKSARADVSASWFCHADGQGLRLVAEIADVVVVCRARYSARVSDLINRCAQRGIKIVYDVDDLVVDPGRAQLILQSLDQNPNSEDAWNYWFGYIARLAATMEMCQEVIVTNAYLASQVQRLTDKRVSIIRNFVNRAQLDVSDRIFEDKRDKKFERDAHLHLGYFSGSPSHNKDFEIVAGALAKLLDRDQRFRLRIVGYLDVKAPLLRHADRIERYPMQDYLSLQHLIASTELNLVPLQDNVFTNCKSELKYFEAAIVGTATIASPVFTFSEAIKDDHNGWLSAAYEWEVKLNEAVKSVDDISRYVEMADRARDHAKELFSWNVQFQAIDDALF
jgi:glycosyltransferase involved in cell wall biosynthesis